MPKIEAQRRFFEERADIHPLPEESKDQDFQEFLQSIDIERAQTIKDKPHPTDKGRTLLKDAEQRIEGYLKKKEKATGYQIFDIEEVANINKSLREEYMGKPIKKKVIISDTKDEEKFEPFYNGEINGTSDG